VPRRYLTSLTVTHPSPATCADSPDRAIVVHRMHGKLTPAETLYTGANSTVVSFTDRFGNATAIKFSRTNARTVAAPRLSPSLVAAGVVAADGWIVMMERAAATASDGVADVLGFVDFVVAVYREAVTRGVCLSDLKPSNIGRFDTQWRLIDHDMIAAADDLSAVSSWGRAPVEVGGTPDDADDSWIALTRWAALVTATWPIMSNPERAIVVTPSSSLRYSTVSAALTTNNAVTGKLESVGIFDRNDARFVAGM
jgi:hypothetical protein